MDTQGATGIATAILLLSFILIGATAASVIMGGTGKDSEGRDIEELIITSVDETIDEISTYIQIKDVMGKYYTIDEKQKIQKIAVLIKPLISVDIDISELMIKLNNGKQIKMLYYSGQADFISSNSLFEHPICNTIRTDKFGFVITLDKDRSIVDYGIINDNTDMAYIVIKLPENFTMEKGDNLEITLFPSKGITKTINIEAPLPIKQVVSLN